MSSNSTTCHRLRCVSVYFPPWQMRILTPGLLWWKKTSLADVFKAMNGLEFYLYFVTELLGSIPPEKRQNATLILDEFSSTPNLRTELRRIMDARGVPRQFKRVLIRSSARESLIQVADLVAGAILRRDTKNDSGAFEYVAQKMINVLEYRG